jgi:hypothetical protein
MIESTEGRGKGCFSRLGAFDLQFNLESHPKLLQLLSTRSNALVDESLYQEILEPDESSMKQYTITLV